MPCSFSESDQRWPLAIVILLCNEWICHDYSINFVCWARQKALAASCENGSVPLGPKILGIQVMLPVTLKMHRTHLTGFLLCFQRKTCHTQSPKMFSTESGVQSFVFGNGFFFVCRPSWLEVNLPDWTSSTANAHFFRWLVCESGCFFGWKTPLNAMRSSASKERGNLCDRAPTPWAGSFSRGEGKILKCLKWVEKILPKLRDKHFGRICCWMHSAVAQICFGGNWTFYW